jgi:hypothetical protein
MTMETDSRTDKANGVGLLLGPLGAGVLAGSAGLGPVLLAGAGAVAAASLLAPRESILPQADVQPGRHPGAPAARVAAAGSLCSG